MSADLALFEEARAALGSPSIRGDISRADLDAIAGRVPAVYCAFLESVGASTFLDGLTQLVDPIDFDGVLRLVLADDPDLPATQCTTIALSAFGTMAVWHPRYGVFDIDLLQGQVSARRLTKPSDVTPSPERMMAIGLTVLHRASYEAFDDNGKPLFKRALKAYGPLRPGQIYAPKLHPALGGPRRLDNFRIASAVEALSLMAQATTFSLRDFSTLPGRHVRDIGR